MNTTSVRSSVPDCLGLPSDSVRLASYCPEWQDVYKSEMHRINLAINPVALSLEHIGSTAVSGLPAKPIIDIMAGVLDRTDIFTVDALLQTLGYTAKGEMGIPGRRFFTFGDPCTFHLHLVQKEGTLWKNHLAFRDKLISDPVVAKNYQMVKHALAQQYPHNREAYTTGKAGFIEHVLETVQMNGGASSK